jgi:tritrans,polycis-undecaprenyl-diphosphate synthase [geranylgeranyl-diphosphate specific]
LAYGGRAEIVDAARNIAREVETGELKLDAIDEQVFEKYLYTAYLPKQDPDLIIRTSGEERLSGFLLWQSAYSELCFLDVYWPEFRRIDLLRAMRTYQQRKRKFGK